MSQHADSWTWLLELGFVTMLYLALVHVIVSETTTPGSGYSRDQLFVKPRAFAKPPVDKNKTRFTAEEKLLILQIHNSYRAMVDPPATDMRELVWDDDLEEYAWNHTQKCTGAHSGGTMVKKWYKEEYTWEKWWNMGENLYYSYAPWYSIEEALFMFWEEGRYYDIHSHTCQPNRVCGHYRVMMTNESWRIGCAMNTCNNFTNSGYPTPAIFFSCDYNGKYIVYNRPYTVGDRGSDCTKSKQGYQFQFCRFGLCISPAMYYKAMNDTGFDGNTSVVGLQDRELTCSTRTTTTYSSTTVTAVTNITTETTEQHTTTEFHTTTPESTLSTSISERSTFFSTLTSESSTTLSTPSTERSSTTFSTPSTERSSTTFSTPSTERPTISSTSLVPPQTDTTTTKRVTTTAQMVSTTKETATKRTVCKATNLHVSHHLLVVSAFILFHVVSLP